VIWRHEIPKLWRAIKQLRARRYDLAIEMRGDIRDILFTALSGPRAIVGSSMRGGGPFLDREGPTDEDTHRVEFNLAIAAAADAPAPPTRPRLRVSAAARARAQQWLDDDEAEYIAVHLGSGFVSKQVPVPIYVAALQQIQSSGALRRIILLGGSNEAPLAREFASLADFPYLDLVGRANLDETAAVLERCRLFIGNDSAPMHIAASVGTPVVACFGPSPFAIYGPYGVPHRIVSLHLPCSPCDQVNCIFPNDLYRCVTTISPQAIAEAAESLLSGESGVEIAPLTEAASL
jgi:ADP-heptose:LPS heptosyltransferase